MTMIHKTTLLLLIAATASVAVVEASPSNSVTPAFTTSSSLPRVASRHAFGSSAAGPPSSLLRVTASMPPQGASDSSDTTTDANGATIMPIAEQIDWDWQGLATKVFSGEDQRPIILFDGVCNLCNGGVNFAIDQDETGHFRFASLQSKVGQSLLLKNGKSPHDISTIILMTSPDNAYHSSDAVARICSKLDAKPLQVLGQLGQITPPFIRESLYKLVSQNRYQFGEYDSCRIDFDGTLSSRFVQDPEDEEHRLI